MIVQSYGVLHKALDQAVTLRYIATNPANGCDLPRISKKEIIKPLDKPDLKRLLAVLNGDPEEFLFKVALVTGLRSGELIGLTWDCVDFDNGIIRIVQQMTSPRKPGEDYEIEETKSSNYRILSPAPITFEWLKQQQAKQASEKQLLEKAWSSGRYKDLVFTMVDGRHYKFLICSNTKSSLTYRETLISRQARFFSVSGKHISCWIKSVLRMQRF